MNMFETVKSAVTVKQAAEYYGCKVNRGDMICCPFHDDRHPSMKLNRDYFYCFGCGAMRDALSIFDQVVSFCGKDLTYDKVIENLNVLDYDYYFKLTDLFHDGKVAETFLLFNEIMEKGFDAGNLVSGLGRHFRDLLVAKEEVTVQLLEVSASIKERYLKQAKTVTSEFIFDALKVIEQCEMQYKMRVEKRLCVELTLIKLCQINELKKKALA